MSASWMAKGRPRAMDTTLLILVRVDKGYGVGIGERYLSIMYKEKKIRLRYSITSDGRLA